MRGLEGPCWVGRARAQSAARAELSRARSRLQKCIAMCMDRYMDAWNTVSRAYNSRLQRERANM